MPPPRTPPALPTRGLPPRPCQFTALPIPALPVAAITVPARATLRGTNTVAAPAAVTPPSTIAVAGARIDSKPDARAVAISVAVIVIIVIVDVPGRGHDCGARTGAAANCEIVLAGETGSSAETHLAPTARAASNIDGLAVSERSDHRVLCSGAGPDIQIGFGGRRNRKSRTGGQQQRGARRQQFGLHRHRLFLGL